MARSALLLETMNPSLLSSKRFTTRRRTVTFEIMTTPQARFHFSIHVNFYCLFARTLVWWSASSAIEVRASRFDLMCVFIIHNKMQSFCKNNFESNVLQQRSGLSCFLFSVCCNEFAFILFVLVPLLFFFFASQAHFSIQSVTPHASEQQFGLSFFLFSTIRNVFAFTLPSHSW